MKFLTKTDEYELASGRRIKAHMGILGLTTDPELGGREACPVLTQGYDGLVHYIGEDDEYLVHPMTSDERREIADFMIDLWMRWAQ